MTTPSSNTTLEEIIARAPNYRPSGVLTLHHRGGDRLVHVWENQKDKTVSSSLPKVEYGSRSLTIEMAFAAERKLEKTGYAPAVKW